MAVLADASRSASKLTTAIADYLKTLDLPDEMLAAVDWVAEYVSETEKLVKYEPDAIRDIVSWLEQVITDPNSVMELSAKIFQQRDPPVHIRWARKMKDRGHDMPIVENFLFPYLKEATHEDEV